MAAIITDQLRILNAKNFVDSVQDSSNSYYAWIGLPDAPEFRVIGILLHLPLKIVWMTPTIIGTP